MATSAYDLQRQMLQEFNIPASADVIAIINQGAIDNDSEDLIVSRLRDTDTWKQRFKGNAIRLQKGLAPLREDQYLANESSYQSVLRNAGLPSGFYDDPEDFANLIGGNVSVGELQDRVNIAGDIINREDPAVLDQLAARGINAGMLLAHALDPERAAPLIKREQNSVLIGAAAQRAGISGVNPNVADDLAQRGIGEAQAQQGFGQINDFLGDTAKLGDVYGVNYDSTDAIDEVFDGGSGDKRKRLARTERSAFSGQNNYGVVRRNTGGAF